MDEESNQVDHTVEEWKAARRRRRFLFAGGFAVVFALALVVSLAVLGADSTLTVFLVGGTLAAGSAGWIVRFHVYLAMMSQYLSPVPGSPPSPATYASATPLVD